MNPGEIDGQRQIYKLEKIELRKNLSVCTFTMDQYSIYNFSLHSNLLKLP